MAHRHVPRHLRDNAKSMRREMTEAELRLWNVLRAKRLMGLKFRRQQPIGNYIADFVCPEHRLVIEVDGGQHAEDGALVYDKNRTSYLNDNGWTVIRFWNQEVLKNIDNCCSHIIAILEEKGVRFDD